MDCDICGRNGELYRAVIEDAQMNVCQSCGSFGKILEKVYSADGAGKQKTGKEKGREWETHEANAPEEMELVVENFSDVIKSAREKSGMTQKEFAKKINEKESVVHKIETGNIKPSITMARKLERILKVKLIEEYEESHDKEKVSDSKSDYLTIGDFIKLRKK